MQTYNINHQEQDSSHTFQVKPIQANHPIYMTSASSQSNISTQKISQELDVKNIGLLIATKALIIILYFLFSNFKLLDFIFVSLLISIDFWMNKNIYGKQLAGLRWWIQLDEYSQQQHWVFQSADPNIQVNKINHAIFWITNAVIALFWFVNFIIIVIITNQLFWVGLCVFSLGMTLINLVCFYKCRGNHQKKLLEIMDRVGIKSATHLLSKSQNMKDNQGYNHQEQKFDIQ